MQTVALLWYAYVSEMFWQSSVVISLVLVAYYFLRKHAPSLRYAILCLVLQRKLFNSSEFHQSPFTM